MVTTNVHKLLVTTLFATLVNNFSLMLLFTNFVHNFWSKLLFSTFFSQLLLAVFGTKFVKNYFSLLFSQQIFTTHGQNIWSKLLFSTFFRTFVGSVWSQNLLTTLVLSSFLNRCLKLMFKIFFTNHAQFCIKYDQSFHSKLLFTSFCYNSCLNISSTRKVLPSLTEYQ